MASILVLLIIAGCGAYQYLKGNLVKAFIAFVLGVIASAAAFSYFEPLAQLLISSAHDGKFAPLVPWAQMLCFLLLFVLVFALLQTAAAYFIRQDITLSFFVDRIGRVCIGIFLGLFFSGIFLTALAMAPLPNKYPYQRFDSSNVNQAVNVKPANNVFLNADGFATGFFSLLSKGSFSDSKSFAVLHPDYLNQSYLNRYAHNISMLTSEPALEITKDAVSQMPPDLKDSEGKSAPIKAGHNLMTIQIGIKRKVADQAGTFTLSQFRLICKNQTDRNKLTGSAVNAYPVGYLDENNRLVVTDAGEVLTIQRSDFADNAKILNLVFSVPNSMTPVLAEFKANNVVDVPVAKQDASQSRDAG
ncbi:MAG: CvpA family protein [Phycisphaerae bacterium]|nr:CvpA family protein [Phycisphaerae bacterium]